MNWFNNTYFMRNLSIPFYLFLFTCLFLTFGCEDDDMPTPIVEEEEPVLTELPGLIDFNRRAFGIQLYEGNMLVQTENTDIRLLPDGSRSNHLEIAPRTVADATSPTLHAKIINEAVHLEFTGISPFSNGPRFRFPVTELGDDARLYPERVRPPNRIAALSDDNYLLLPFRREGDSRLWLSILEITYEDEPSMINVPELASVKTVVLPTTDFTNQITHGDMLPVPGGFLVTLFTVNIGFPTYRINYDGTFEQVLNGNLVQMFRYNDELLGIRRSRPNLDIMTADENGRNWAVKYQLPNELNITYRFFPTAEDLFVQARSGGQLFVTTQFTADSLRIEALDTPEIDSRTVTDLENYNGNTYITTLSGTFIGEAERLRSSRRE
jgi:hypothetical protein